MIKKVPILFAVVIGLILSAAYVASGSPISASQSLPELPARSAAASGLGDPYRTMAAVDPCDVDLNENGVVDVDDIMEVANRWRMTDSDPNWDPRYDLDGDGIITIVDIMLVAAQWGNTCGTPTPTPTNTPTPTFTPTRTPTPTPTATSTPGTPVPPLTVPGLAIDMGGYDTDPTRRDLAAAAGFNMHRTSVSWASIEPNAPVGGVHTYYWPDSTFNKYRDDPDLMPYVFVNDNPPWAAVPDDPRRCGPIKDEHLDNGNFYDFVFNLVSRYADVTPYWVFYNEQDHWTDLTDHQEAGGCWGGHGAEYAQMLAIAWDAAHSANPHAQVIFGAVAYEPKFDITTHVWDEFFFRDAFSYMDAHADDYVDIIMANQYNFRRDDWDGGSSTLPRNQEIIAKFKKAVGDDNSTFNVNEPYSVAKWQSKYGLNKPMASGEVGLHVGWWGTAEDPNVNDLQARHVVHVNVRGLAAGLKIITWYTLVDKPNDWKMGLLQNNLTPRPAYYAYQVLTQQLAGYEFDQQLVVSSNPRIQAYRFDNNGVKKLVLWRDSGEAIKSQSSTATETMTVSTAELGTWTGQVRVTDKLGNARIEYGGSSVDLTLSSDPIYVEAY